MSAKKERFLLLYNSCKERLDRFALYLTRDRQLARELVSETIARAYHGFESLRDDKAFLGWLFSICFREHKRSKERDKKIIYLEAGKSFQELFSINSGTSEYASNYDVEVLYASLEQLPEHEREAVLLAEVFGFSHKEIADLQNSSVNSIKMRVSRAKAKLRTIMVESDSWHEKNKSNMDCKI